MLHPDKITREEQARRLYHAFLDVRDSPTGALVSHTSWANLTDKDREPFFRLADAAGWEYHEADIEIPIRLTATQWNALLGTLTQPRLSSNTEEAHKFSDMVMKLKLQVEAEMAP